MGEPMSRVMIVCPETEKLVYTGMNFDWFAFESTRIAEKSVICPACGREHLWDRKDAYLESDGGEN